LEKNKPRNNQQAEEQIPKAYASTRAVLIFLAVVAAAAFIDLYGKHAVFSSLLAKPEIEEQTSSQVQYILKSGKGDIPDPNTQEFTRLVLQHMDIHEEVFPAIRFSVSTNPGIVFGFDKIPSVLINIITVAMIFGVAALFAFSPAGDYWIHTALALILGGAVGNLYDRIFSSVSLPGLEPILTHVRDFIDCRELGYPYIFNPADVWLVAGAVMILLHWIWNARSESKKKQVD